MLTRMQAFWIGFRDGFGLGPFWRWMAKHFPDPDSVVRKDVERSVSIIDQAKALEYARQHGLKIQEPKPETVNTNTLRARALDGVLPAGICQVTEKPVVVIT